MLSLITAHKSRLRAVLEANSCALSTKRVMNQLRLSLYGSLTVAGIGWPRTAFTNFKGN